MHFEGRALMVERIVNFLIRLLPEKSISGDAYTPTDGHKLTLTGAGRVYFKFHTSIFTYRFIDQYFDRLDGQNVRRDKSVQQQTLGRIT